MTAQIPCRPTGDIVGDNAHALQNIWLQVRGERIAPRRRDITLPMVGRLAQWLWWADVIDRGTDYIFRMAGDRVIQFYGRSFNGTHLSALTPIAFMQTKRNAFAHCVKHKAPLVLGPHISSYPDKECWEIEMLFLPLSENGTDVTGIMGSLEYWPVGTHQPATTKKAAMP